MYISNRFLIIAIKPALVWNGCNVEVHFCKINEQVSGSYIYMAGFVL